MNMTFLPPYLRPHAGNLLAGILVVMALINGTESAHKLIKFHKLRQTFPFQFSGFKFSGLNDIFKDVSSIGYLTDGPLTDSNVITEYSHAQYMLAPVVVQLDSADHEYILLNFSKPGLALAKLKEIQAVPIKINSFGIILARNPKFIKPTL